MLQLITGAERNADGIRNMSQPRATALSAGSVCQGLLSELSTGQSTAPCTAAGAALTRGEGHREGADLSEGGSDSRGFLGSPKLPELCQPTGLTGLSTPHKARGPLKPTMNSANSYPEIS